MARSFNGLSDQIDCGSGVPNIGSSAWTIGGWLLRSHLFTSIINYPLVSRWTNNTTNRQIYIYFTGGAGLNNKIQVDIPFIAAILTSTGTIADTTTWHSWAVTRSGSNWILYIDGAQDSTASNAAASETGGNWQIGFSSADMRFFNGNIAETFVSNVAWTAGEVAAFNKGALPKDIRAGTVTGYWPINGLSSPEPDFSGNANNGTVTGTALVPGPPVMQFTPRWPQFWFPPPPTAVVFRKTLSQIGGRVGTRQPQGWAG